MKASQVTFSSVLMTALLASCGGGGGGAAGSSPSARYLTFNARGIYLGSYNQGSTWGPEMEWARGVELEIGGGEAGDMLLIRRRLVGQINWNVIFDGPFDSDPAFTGANRDIFDDQLSPANDYEWVCQLLSANGEILAEGDAAYTTQDAAYSDAPVLMPQPLNYSGWQGPVLVVDWDIESNWHDSVRLERRSHNTGEIVVRDFDVWSGSSFWDRDVVIDDMYTYRLSVHFPTASPSGSDVLYAVSECDELNIYDSEWDGGYHDHEYAAMPSHRSNGASNFSAHILSGNAAELHWDMYTEPGPHSEGYLEPTGLRIDRSLSIDFSQVQHVEFLPASATSWIDS